MRLFTCPNIEGHPRLTPSACADRHLRGVRTSRKWGCQAPKEWFMSQKVCEGCSIGAAHAKGHDSSRVTYKEYGT